MTGRLGASSVCLWRDPGLAGGRAAKEVEAMEPAPARRSASVLGGVLRVGLLVLASSVVAATLGMGPGLAVGALLALAAIGEQDRLP
jgi:hypothetical protein